ncbi:hypothetical protein PMIN06_001690 [Paraphaeosphaeria minitans]
MVERRHGEGTATHAMVVAQLLLPDGSTAQPSPALPIRHEKSHQPLQDIAVGDIGPKYGYASMDKGYMLFDRARVPKSAMLSRYAEVSDQTDSHACKAGIGSDGDGRCSILCRAACSFWTAMASPPRPPRPQDQVQVFDYPTVQIRILPLLAANLRTALHG